MKLALILAGHLRTCDTQNIHSIQQLMKGYDYDVFIATHNTLERSEQKHYYGHDIVITEEKIREVFAELPVKGLQITTDTDCSSRKCIVCNEGTPEWATIIPVTHDMGVCSTHCEKCKTENMEKVGNSSYSWRIQRNITEGYQLCKDYEKKNNITYNYYIRTRPDLLYMEQIDFSKLPKLDDKLIIGFGSTLGYPNDQFAIGSGEAFECYCSMKHVVEKSLFAHYVLKEIIASYPIYKFFDIAVRRRILDPETNTYTKMEFRWHPKYQYITDKNLRDF